MKVILHIVESSSVKKLRMLDIYGHNVEGTFDNTPHMRYKLYFLLLPAIKKGDVKVLSLANSYR